MTENERVKQLRKSLDLTLEKFGDRLGVTKVAISNIENGKRAVTEQMSKAICREFNVSEDWLRNGVGDMFKQRDGSFSEILSELDDSDDDFIKSFITVYMELDEDSKEVLRQIATKMSEKYKKPD
nr:MAG TPA: Helix-turn-helix XRE-family like protein [Caudoviricetes sp.]